MVPVILNIAQPTDPSHTMAQTVSKGKELIVFCRSSTEALSFFFEISISLHLYGDERKSLQSIYIHTMSLDFSRVQ